MCDSRLHGGVLICTRTDSHVSGCVFEASSASDSHDLSEQAAEVSRG